MGGCRTLPEQILAYPSKWETGLASTHRPAETGSRSHVEKLDPVGILLVDRLASQLHRRRQFGAAGFPEGRQYLVLLDLLDPRELFVSCGDALGDDLHDPRVAAEGHPRRLAQPGTFGVRGAGVWVERDERHVVWAVVTDRDDAADERTGGLDGVLDVGGGHVLSRKIDDQFLLAIDDREVAVFVHRADVAGQYPAVDDRLGGTCRVLAVALHHQRPARHDFAVLGQLDLHAKRCGSDRSDLVALGWVHRREPGELRHAP